MLTVEISIDALNLGVRNGIWRYRLPDDSGGDLRTKVLTLQDGATGIVVKAALALEGPPNMELPEDFLPPALSLARELNKPWEDADAEQHRADITVVQAIPEAMNRADRRSRPRR